MIYNQNSGWGQALLNNIASQVPAMGNVYVVMDPDDTDEDNYHVLQDVILPDADGKIRFFTSFESAYAACESNNNDVILLDGNSTHIIADGIAWTKNRIHVFGMDGGDRLVQQGAKIQNTAGVATQYVLKVTGVRNSFRNVKLIQVNTETTALTVLECGGEGNLYKNVTATFGVVDNLDLTTAHEVVMGEDSGTFIDCLFGTETLLTSADRSVMDIDQVTTSQECKSNIFKDCTYLLSTSQTAANFIRVRAAGDVLFTNLWINPIFMASVDTAGGVAVADAVESVASITKGVLNFMNPAVFNCTNFCTTATRVQVVGNSMADSGDADVSATVGVGQTPS